MKEIYFSKDTGKLIDEEGIIYLGKRFDSVGTTGPISPSPEDALRDSRINLEIIAEKKGATAYEVVASFTHFDTGNEYDSQPYSAQLIALLYR